MNDFAAVTSAARSLGGADCAEATRGMGVDGGPASAAEFAEAQATHIETRANAKPLGKAILIGSGARGLSRIVEMCPVIAFHRLNSGANQRSQAGRGAPLYL